MSREEKSDVTQSQICEIVVLDGIFTKIKSKKSLLPIIILLLLVKVGLFWWLYTFPSKIGLDCNVSDPGLFQKDLFGIRHRRIALLHQFFWL